MVFDLEEGLYIFEITLGYQVDESEYMTVPFILRADDANEARVGRLRYCSPTSGPGRVV